MTSLLDVSDLEMQERIDRMRALRSIQEAELAQVQTWTWERLRAERPKGRRRREVISVALHPTGWIANLGFERPEVCQAVFDQSRSAQPWQT